MGLGDEKTQVKDLGDTACGQNFGEPSTEILQLVKTQTAWTPLFLIGNLYEGNQVAFN